MAVVYMKKLEQEPSSYERKFTKLTKGANLEVHKWILEKIKPSDNILEVGCGPGTLALKIAEKASMVEAIDKNPKMIAEATKRRTKDLENKINFDVGAINDLDFPPSEFDVIITTFMLSELRPFEQQIFLRTAWKFLKPSGKLLLAEEFVPSSVWKLGFKMKQWWYKKKLKLLRSGLSHPLKWFSNYIKPVGFKGISEQRWKHGSIKTIELLKEPRENGAPGYYRPVKKSFKGVNAKLRIARCLFTGQFDHVPIEPGIYQSGNPTPESPVLVTANYDYTYIKVMNDLKGIDAWVLCVDSQGINVWCAARGNDFGNLQLVEAVEATGVQTLTNKKTILLPQLAAGGVAAPDLYEKYPNFPFKILYGPIWSKDLPRYLKEKPARKPNDMKLAKFTFSHRLKAGVTHTTFLLRKIFLKIAFVLLLVMILLGGFNKTWILGELLIAVIVTNMLLAIIFPITNFTRCFVKKRIVFWRY